MGPHSTASEKPRIGYSACQAPFALLHWPMRSSRYAGPSKRAVVPTGAPSLLGGAGKDSSCCRLFPVRPSRWMADSAARFFVSNNAEQCRTMSIAGVMDAATLSTEGAVVGLALLVID
jgi:hypothetical protein